ncbi:MAG TPA: pirin family protein [Pseudomonadales bacterium]
MSEAKERKVVRLITAEATSDGAGVRLRRSLGQTPSARLDPFLMLDEFASDDPDDYIAGFPDHPHRGFETVTYMLEGRMLHQDHLGNRGRLQSGGAQWMTAGRGIIHSEMPEQRDGRLHGFQLWINLPAKEKLKPAGYRDVAPDEIPELEVPGQFRARVLAGRLEAGGRTVEGPIRGVSTAPCFFDVALAADGRFEQPLPADRNAFLYVFEGTARIGEQEVPSHRAALLSAGEAVAVHAVEGPARFLLLAARPLGEPVVQYGPFVMNTREEIEQALEDYRTGRLA